MAHPLHSNRPSGFPSSSRGGNPLWAQLVLGGTLLAALKFLAQPNFLLGVCTGQDLGLSARRSRPVGSILDHSRGGGTPLQAEQQETVGRRNFLEVILSPGPYSAIFWVLFTFICFSLTREEKVRRAKLCVRSKQFVEDFMADPKKKAFLAAKGIKEEDMRKYLQGEDCMELPEFIESFRNAKAFWEVGEQYNVG